LYTLSGLTRAGSVGSEREVLHASLASGLVVDRSRLRDVLALGTTIWTLYNDQRTALEV